jgi:hypothetical protein
MLFRFGLFVRATTCLMYFVYIKLQWFFLFALHVKCSAHKLKTKHYWIQMPAFILA